MNPFRADKNTFFKAYGVISFGGLGMFNFFLAFGIICIFER